MRKAKTIYHFRDMLEKKATKSEARFRDFLRSARIPFEFQKVVTGQQKSFTIVADPALQMNFSDALVVAPGRWYILRVSDTATQSGSFGIAWPEWSQG